MSRWRESDSASGHGERSLRSRTGLPRYQRRRSPPTPRGCDARTRPGSAARARRGARHARPGMGRWQHCDDSCCHRPGTDPELLHHRPHRPRQVDAGRPDAGGHRAGRGAQHARPVPRPHGHRARARHHHQGAERPAAVDPAVGRAHRHPVRARHDRHPRARGLHVRGVPVAGRLRGRGPARRRRPGHRGADAGQPLPGAGERPHDHPGAQQDRPAGRPARAVRRGDRAHHRLRARRRAAGQRQDRHRRPGAARPDRGRDPRAHRPRRGSRPRDDLRLGLRHLPRRHHLRPRRRRPHLRPRQDQDDVDRRHPRAARDRRHLARAQAGREPRRRRGRLLHHRGEGRPPVPRRRHRDAAAQAGGRVDRRLPRPQADGLLRPLSDRRQRLPAAARGPGQAAAQRRRADLRARDLRGARLRLPGRLPRPAPPGDRPRAARARGRHQPHLRPRRTSSTGW